MGRQEIKQRKCLCGCPKIFFQVSHDSDADLVLVLRSLGAVLFCRTNCAQLCLSYDCSNPVYGETRNPRDPGRTPGGSSSGEGALVALGGSVGGIGGGN